MVDDTKGYTQIFYAELSNLQNIQRALLTTDSEDHVMRAWNPVYVNDKIVFVSHRDHNGAGEIYSMNRDGTNQKNLTNDGVDEYFFWD